jgi:hypothetical protein
MNLEIAGEPRPDEVAAIVAILLRRSAVFGAVTDLGAWRQTRRAAVISVSRRANGQRAGQDRRDRLRCR